MFYGIDFEPLHIFILKLLIFFQRPSIQIQFLAIFGILTFAWSLSLLEQVFFTQREKPKALWPLIWHVLITFIRYLGLPIYGLLATALIRQIILANGGVVGLLTQLNFLFGALLLFRFLLACLYSFFNQSTIRRYHYRLFSPLFVLFVTTEVLAIFTDLQPISKIVITNIFDSAIELGSLVRSLIAIYLWIGILWISQDILVRIYFRNRNKIEKENLIILLSIIRFFLVGFGVIVFLNNLGFNSTTIAAIGGGLSVGIGFGLQEVFGNFFSGIFIFLEGALKPGDVIEVDGEMSIVKRFGFRATTVQTFDSVEKIIPNQSFFTSSVVTYTGSDRINRVLIPVGVSYSSDPEQVIELLYQVAKQHPTVLSKPESKVFFLGFGESSIDFELAVWINDPTIRKTTRSEINRLIWKTLQENKIEIPFPQRDLHLRSGFTPDPMLLKPQEE